MVPLGHQKMKSKTRVLEVFFMWEVVKVGPFMKKPPNTNGALCEENHK